MTPSTPDVILAALLEPVMTTDAQGVMTYTNPAGIRRFGWDKLIGAPLADRISQASFFKPDRSPVTVSEDPVARALAGRRPVIDYRVTSEVAPGRWETFAVNAVPLMDGDTLLGAACTVRDVTAIHAEA